MKKNDLIILILFFVLLIVLSIALIKIYLFMPILKTCEDDFEIINKCGCVPCSWKYAEDYNKIPCFTYDLNLSNGK